MATCSINANKARNFTAFRSFLFWLMETVVKPSWEMASRKPCACTLPLLVQCSSTHTGPQPSRPDTRARISSCDSDKSQKPRQ